MNPARRGLYGPPPQGHQTNKDSHSTLLFSWFCTMMSFTVIIIRIFGRLTRNSQLFREDKVMLLSLIPLFGRMALIHVVLIWGTNNVDTSVEMSAEDIRHREIGSRLVLAARILYAMFIWTAKFTVSEFLKRLTYSYWRKSYQVSLHIIRVFLVVSFIAVVIATLAECHPVDHYWQVVPDPGPQCRQQYAQLITMAAADVITDILLIVFPLTILIPTGMPMMRKFKLGALFSINSILIAITTVRVINVVNNQGKQQRRTVFASGEIVAAAAVSNCVIVGSFLRDRGVKKAKWRSSGHSDSIAGGSILPEGGPQSRRTTLGNLVEAGDSDEELFKDMNYRSQLADPNRESSVPRKAQAVSHADLESHDSRANSLHPHTDSRSSSVTRGRPRLGKKASSNSGRGLGARPTRLVKTVTFSDPGGLLDSADSDVTTIDMAETAGPSRMPLFGNLSTIDTAGRVPTADRASETTRAGSMAELQDIGGLLPPERRQEDDDIIKEIH